MADLETKFLSVLESELTALEENDENQHHNNNNNNSNNNNNNNQTITDIIKQQAISLILESKSKLSFRFWSKVFFLLISFFPFPFSFSLFFLKKLN